MRGKRRKILVYRRIPPVTPLFEPAFGGKTPRLTAKNSFIQPHFFPLNAATEEVRPEDQTEAANSAFFAANKCSGGGISQFCQ
jgi:hypothetical protein